MGVPHGLYARRVYLQNFRRAICRSSNNQFVQGILVDVRRAIVFWSVRWRKTTLPLRRKCFRSSNEGHRSRGWRSSVGSAHRQCRCAAIRKRRTVFTVYKTRSLNETGCVFEARRIFPIGYFECTVDLRHSLIAAHLNVF